MFTYCLLLATLAAAVARAEGPAPARPAVAAVVEAFTRHPVVAIAEPHGLRQAGDFYIALANDPDFQRRVNDIVIEFASGQCQALLDRYIVKCDSLPADSVRMILRSSTKLGWDSAMYARWLAAIRDANRSRPPASRTRVLAGDTPFDWSRLRTPQDWAALGPNDVSFARVICDSVLAKHRRALVVLGSNHLAHGGSFRDHSPNTATRVEARYPGSMYVVLLFSGWPGGDTTEARIVEEHWPVPSLTALAGNWTGALMVVNAAAAYRLETRADALLFLGTTQALDLEPPLRSELETYDVNELDRRSWLEWGDSTRIRRFLNLGRVDEYRMISARSRGPRRLWVYTPPGYSRRDSAANDLLLVFDGGVYLQDIPLPAILDSLTAAKRIHPTVAVMLDDSSQAARLADLANHESFAGFIAGELIPWVRAGWNVTRDPHRTTIAGTSAGGLASAFIALRHPEVFGNVLSQSGAFWRGAEGSNSAPFEWVTTQYASAPRRDIRLFLDVGSTESVGAMGGTAPSILDANRRLRDVLLAKGYPMTYTEVEGGHHAPDSWRPRMPVGLVTLSDASRPAPPAATRR